MPKLTIALTGLAALVSVGAYKTTRPEQAEAAVPEMYNVAEADTSIHWGPAPAVFPAGAELAVLAGDPSSHGEFTVRLRFPNGYRVMPHTHPTDENITVISGTFKVGMGEKFDAKATMTLKPGGFATAPANHAHYATAVGQTVVQVNAMGPFTLTYVDPNDLPRVAAKP